MIFASCQCRPDVNRPNWFFVTIRLFVTNILIADCSLQSDYLLQLFVSWLQLIVCYHWLASCQWGADIKGPNQLIVTDCLLQLFISYNCLVVTDCSLQSDCLLVGYCWLFVTAELLLVTVKQTSKEPTDVCCSPIVCYKCFIIINWLFVTINLLFVSMRQASTDPTDFYNCFLVINCLLQLHCCYRLSGTIWLLVTIISYNGPNINRPNPQRT